MPFRHSRHSRHSRTTHATRASDTLQRALRAAVAAHHPETLHALAVAHGDRACACARPTPPPGLRR